MIKLRFINPLSDTERVFFNDIGKKISNIEGILSGSCTYDNSMCYFALYFVRNLKVTFSYYTDKETSITTTFIDSASNEIIRIETFNSIDDIINILSVITDKLLYATVEEIDNITAIKETIK